MISDAHLNNALFYSDSKNIAKLAEGWAEIRLYEIFCKDELLPADFTEFESYKGIPEYLKNTIYEIGGEYSDMMTDISKTAFTGQAVFILKHLNKLSRSYSENENNVLKFLYLLYKIRTNIQRYDVLLFAGIKDFREFANLLNNTLNSVSLEDIRNMFEKTNIEINGLNERLRIPFSIENKGSEGVQLLIDTAEFLKKEDKALPKLAVYVPLNSGFITAEDEDAIKKAIYGAKEDLGIREEIEVLFFEDTGSEVSNTKLVSALAQEKGINMAVPVRREIGAKEFISEISNNKQLLYLTQTLFSLTVPELDNLDQSRMMLESKLDEVSRLFPALSPVRIYNDRMVNIVRRQIAVDALTINGNAYINDNDKQSVISMRANSLGELKMIAEAHRERMKNVQHKIDLQIRLDVKPSEKDKINNKNMESILDQMEISDVVIGDNVIITDGTETLEDITNMLKYKGYGENDIVIAERFDENRNENNIPQGIKLMEYEGPATAYVYDAALELMARVEGYNNIKGLELYKKWFKYIPPIDKKNLEALIKEIERYHEVMIRA